MRNDYTWLRVFTILTCNKLRVKANNNFVQTRGLGVIINKPTKMVFAKKKKKKCMAKYEPKFIPGIERNIVVDAGHWWLSLEKSKERS